MPDITTNRKAHFNYEILETFEAGMVLSGSEVKSLRKGQASLSDSYAISKGSEFYLINCHIAPYEYAGYAGHEPRRERKLLLKLREIDKLIGTVREKGLTLVPIKLYFKGPWVKVLIGVGRGKKNFDKRATIKNREANRETARELRGRRS